MVQQGARPASGRSVLAVALTAAVTLVPAPHRGTISDPPTRLSAAVLPFDLGLQSPVDDIVGAALPDTTATAGSSIGDGIIGVYLTLEQWVQYGVDLLSWALRWVPFGGLLAAQLNMFYALGESIVRSMVFNTAYFLDGTVDFTGALSDIGSATSAAFTTFVNDQIAWVQHLLPPLPPPADAPVPNPEALLNLGGLPDPDTPMNAVAELDGILLGLTP